MNNNDIKNIIADGFKAAFGGIIADKGIDHASEIIAQSIEDAFEMKRVKTKLVKNYSYSMEESIDDNCDPCNAMTIYVHFVDGSVFSIGDITVGINDTSEYLQEICEETIQNYGYEFIEEKKDDMEKMEDIVMNFTGCNRAIANTVVNAVLTENEKQLKKEGNKKC